MSVTAEAILEQVKQLPPADQQEIIRQLLRWGLHTPPSQQKPFPTVKVRGGIITSVQVAEALDDE
ncbi:MAG: hypothetical protein HY735_27170 [Verrucomicrobia bacterium]|nr:hypothetical protein [Verrucomicrobiota bacterium]